MVDQPEKKLYGIDVDLHNKALSKLDPKVEEHIIKWIEKTLGEKISGNIYDELKDGIKLCKLMNKFRPGLIPVINTKLTPLSERDNIKLYLETCTRIGMAKSDLFLVGDLHDKKYLPSVVQNLLALEKRFADIIMAQKYVQQKKERRVKGISRTMPVDVFLQALQKRDNLNSKDVKDTLKVFNKERIKQVGHLYTLNQRKDYWDRLTINSAIKTQIEECLVDLDAAEAERSIPDNEDTLLIPKQGKQEKSCCSACSIC